MSETAELHKKVDSILKKVESIDNFMPWLVKPNSEQLRSELLGLLKKRKRAAKVFLSVDGEKNVDAIALETSIASNHVSSEMTWLAGHGLVERVIDGKNVIYKKNKIDRVLGISKALSYLIGASISNAASLEPVAETAIPNETTSGNNNIVPHTEDKQE